MAEAKTRPTSVPAATLIDAVADPQRRADCIALTGLMHAATGMAPVVWGRDIVGFGTWTMRYASGKSADWPLLAFSPRKTDLTLYVMDGFDGHRERLRRLGRCRIGKSCLYIRRLADVDVDVLMELLAASVDAMRMRHG